MTHTTNVNNALSRPLTYIQVLGMNYPDLAVSSQGDGSDYASLRVSGNGVLPSVEELDIEMLEDFREHRIADLSARCQQDITSGFISDGLGYPCIYDSEEVDQLNLIGAVAATAPTEEHPEGFIQYYAVRALVDDIPQPKQYIPHTNANLRKVLADGAIVKLTKLQKFNNKRNIILNATTIAQIDAVTWESEP